MDLLACPLGSLSRVIKAEVIRGGSRPVHEPLEALSEEPGLS